MTSKENQSQNAGSASSSTKTGLFTSLISRVSLWKKLKSSKESRAKFVESHLNRTIAYQIRSLRDRESWTQKQLAEQLGIDYANNVSARLENPHYGSHSLTTLKKVASVFDVALVVWFVPFSRLADWATNTPHVDAGLRPEFYNIPAFDKDVLHAEPSAEIEGSKAALRGAGASDIEVDFPDDEAFGNSPMLIEKKGLGSVKRDLLIKPQQERMEVPCAWRN
jgi:transcriptional regulator with XRE-family HTH domain